MSIRDGWPNGCEWYGGGYYNTDFPGTHEYDQDLRWLICAYKKLLPAVAELEDAVKNLNDLYEDIPDRINQTINQAMQSVYERMAIVEEEIKQIRIDVNESMQQQDIKIQMLLTNLSDLELYVSTLVKQIYAYVDRQDKALEQRLMSYIDNILVTKWPNVICPVDGLSETINKALEHVYQAIIRPLTVAEFNELHLPVKVFNDTYILVRTFNSWGYQTFKDRFDHRFYMFSPITGNYMLMRDVIMQLYRLHYPDGVTAGELDAGDLSCEVFDAKQLTVTAFNTTTWL